VARLTTGVSVVRISRALGLFSTFVLGAAATIVVMTNQFGDLAHPSRFTMALLIMILIHVPRYMRLWVSRELALNLGFVSYAVLSLIWTTDMHQAMATFPSIVNFTLVLILFSALVAYHNLRALLAGVFAGSLMSAALYTLISGFPFSYPDDFSYNTIAGMYLLGLFMTAVFAAYVRWTLFPIAVGMVLLVLIAATTSIKTNLGTALGIAVATLLYFKLSMRDVLRFVVLLVLLGGSIFYGEKFNPALSDRVHDGFERVSRGLAVLTHREGDSGATGLGNRQGWYREGLKGWAVSPVFGHGVEGFRADHGITSHSTPIDLLYNSGLIGCGLFYGMFASIAWRLLRARDRRFRNVRARIAACLVAYVFISLSGLIYYDPFIAIYIAVASGLLMRLEPAIERGTHYEESGVGEAGRAASPA